MVIVASREAHTILHGYYAMLQSKGVLFGATPANVGVGWRASVRVYSGPTGPSNLITMSRIADFPPMRSPMWAKLKPLGLVLQLARQPTSLNLAGAAIIHADY